MRLVNVISPDMFPLVGVYGNEAPTFSQKLGDMGAISLHKYITKG